MFGLLYFLIYLIMDNLEKVTDEFITSLNPFGYLDMKATAEYLEEAGVEFSAFNDYLEEYIDDV